MTLISKRQVSVTRSSSSVSLTVSAFQHRLSYWLRLRITDLLGWYFDRVLSRRCHSMVQHGKVQNALIVQLLAMGDVIAITPTIRLFRKHFPTCRLAALVTPYTKDLLLTNPNLDEVLVYDRQGANRGLSGYIRFVRCLRAQGFDLVILVGYPTLGSGLLALLSGARCRLGTFDGLFVARKVPWRRDHHIFDYYQSILSPLGVDGQERTEAYPSPSNDEWARAFLKNNGVREKDLVVGINPGHSWTSKLWVAERFAHVADYLANNLGAKVIFISSSQFHSMVTDIVEEMKTQAIDAVGKTNVGQLIALISQLDLLISLDTGTAHLATALGVPSVVLFGSSFPQVWGPYRAEKSKVLQKKVPCGPCDRHRCPLGTNDCMREMGSEEVVRAAEEILISELT